MRARKLARRMGEMAFMVVGISWGVCRWVARGCPTSPMGPPCGGHSDPANAGRWYGDGA